MYLPQQNMNQIHLLLVYTYLNVESWIIRLFISHTVHAINVAALKTVSKSWANGSVVMKYIWASKNAL